MSEPMIYVCHVVTPEGAKDYITLLPPEQTFSRGLAAEAIVGQLIRPLEDGEPITPDGFARNSVFVAFLHAVIARRGPGLPDLVAEAKRQGNGWIHLIDERTRTPDGAVPPEDIIGAFEARGGKVLPHSYQASPRYRILSPDGFFRLSPALHAVLLEELANLPEVPSAADPNGADE
jgi:hypothetical protein